jgi:carbamoyl-phosphate synthase large subunit
MSLVKKLQERKIRVVGLDSDSWSAGLYLCDDYYIVPSGNSSRFLPILLQICDVKNANLLLLGPEEELLAVSRNKQLFEKRSVLPLCPDFETVRICIDKLETFKMLCRHGIPTPETTQDIGKIKFPCIVKPKFSRGSRLVYKVNDGYDLKFYSRKLFLDNVEKPIIQEFVEGTEFSVDIFADLNGKPLSIVPRIRLQVESGISVKSMTVYDSEIIGYCEKIVRTFNLIGPAVIQCIKKDRTIKFIEINARFGGGSILSLEADPSIITNLIRIAERKEPVPSEGFTENLVMMRYYNEVFLSRSKFCYPRWAERNESARALGQSC